MRMYMHAHTYADTHARAHLNLIEIDNRLVSLTNCSLVDLDEEIRFRSPSLAHLTFPSSFCSPIHHVDVTTAALRVELENKTVDRKADSN